MVIEKIKWMVERADGFVFIIDDAGNMQIVYAQNRNWFIGYQKIETWVLYPLLLQRTIEGINREGVYLITMYHDAIGINEAGYQGHSQKTITFYNRTIDEAKQAAIDYVYEQEIEMEINNG